MEVFGDLDKGSLAVCGGGGGRNPAVFEERTGRSGDSELFPSAQTVKVLVSWWCPTLSNPMDCGPPGSSVHRVPQARILEWVAIPFSRGSS